uniref:Uncharacterized protein n=1 Tax=Anguilla anguilla TaxID=7936 RepID=A0A0E9PQ98_ANGAN
MYADILKLGLALLGAPLRDCNLLPFRQRQETCVL